MAQIARVSADLVDVGLVCDAVVFELEDHYGPTDQKDHIGPAVTFTRKFVLEDDVRIAEVAQLIAEQLKAMVPSTFL
jgi:hypothetical protein